MEIKEQKKLSPFDFIGNVSSGDKGTNLFAGVSAADESENETAKSYNSFMVNRGLSYFSDSVYAANEINKHSNMPAKMQYDFYRHVLRPRRRFSKWTKSKTYDTDVAMIAEMYHISKKEASSYVELLTPEQIDECRKYNSKGGR